MSRLALFASLAALAGCGGGTRPIAVGSKNFTEQVLLGEILALHLERTLDARVERRLNLGGTFLCHRSLVAGELDLYVEYTGTALTAILDREPVHDRGEALRLVREGYRQRFDLEWTEPLGFENTFAIVVRGEDARSLGLRTISDAGSLGPRWRGGFGFEFAQRADGLSGLQSRYGLRFREPPLTMDLGLLYRALSEKQVDLVAGNSTDGLLSRLDLVVLEDDRRYFPPYDAAPVVRRETLARVPGLREALDSLGGRLSAETMRRLNQLVDGDRRDARAVARDFLDSIR